MICSFFILGVFSLVNVLWLQERQMEDKNDQGVDLNCDIFGTLIAILTIIFLTQKKNKLYPIKRELKGK